jgi:uncharacterized protein YndB with AHSA1/START domain
MSENNVQKKTTTYVEDLSLVVERTFDAPRELVWDAWTNPEHVAIWWGMGGKLAVCEIDLSPGGAYRYVMRGPDGSEYPFIGVYREVVKPERLVYTRIFDVEPFFIHESLVTDVFEALSDGKTKLTFITEFSSVEALQGSLASGAEAGAIDSMERFAGYIASL